MTAVGKICRPRLPILLDAHDCPPDEPKPSTQQPSAAGADRDEHGCIASAGYRSCEAEKECVRPRELLKKVGRENSPEAFDGYRKNESR